MKIYTKLLTKNQWSRPGRRMEFIKGVVIHWVANPGTTADQNRYFFELRKLGEKGYGSAHYIINLDGNVIQCVPDKEIAYHVGAKKYKEDARSKLSPYPNDCTLGIECTHFNRKGEMTIETYESLIELTVNLCKKYNLRETDLYRHHDITGKDCHKWFVDHLDQWEKFKKNVAAKMNSQLTAAASLDKDKRITLLNEEILNVFKKYFKENPDVWNNFKQSVEA